MTSREVPFPVAECNDFEQEGRMTEYDAKQIGWVLEINKESREIIGFRPPKKEE